MAGFNQKKNNKIKQSEKGGQLQLNLQKCRGGREQVTVQEGRRLAQTLNIDAVPLLLVVDLA